MTLVRNKDGIESVIKSLDGKLSEAIMHAMTNGPELHIKVSQRGDDVNIVVIFLHHFSFYRWCYSAFIKRCCRISSLPFALKKGIKIMKMDLIECEYHYDLRVEFNFI